MFLPSEAPINARSSPRVPSEGDEWAMARPPLMYDADGGEAEWRVGDDSGTARGWWCGGETCVEAEEGFSGDELNEILAAGSWPRLPKSGGGGRRCVAALGGQSIFPVDPWLLPDRLAPSQVR